MKRFLILSGACLALALPATAAARLLTSTHVGSGYASASATGSCSVKRSSKLGTATLACADATGAAVARYRFGLPKGCSSAVKPHVDWQGTAPSIGASVKNGAAVVSVRLTDRGKTAVAMVSIAYSC